MEWIPSKYKVPNFGDHVLVCCPLYGRYTAVYTRLLDTNWGEWKDFNDRLVLPPTHWMPLPEPPSK